ncbi:hypothetical protein EDD18DRAFT_1174825 [Armillaria luteobubalina]|uniref:Uncharacterized protein n=1 Tax=Armillaria luteobubalina TaxID=153913 RepID=A0AA39UMQ0_9AGAR|nr:hypothetical protein EDD18DRAFT_1174825 [Armillaria luteobubalina]
MSQLCLTWLPSLFPQYCTILAYSTSPSPCQRSRLSLRVVGEVTGHSRCRGSSFPLVPSILATSIGLYHSVTLLQFDSHIS